MHYQVKSNGDGTYVVLQEGAKVHGAKVKRIRFPEITSHTANSTIYHPGSGVATITVPGVNHDIENVPLVIEPSNQSN